MVVIFSMSGLTKTAFKMFTTRRNSPQNVDFQIQSCFKTLWNKSDENKCIYFKSKCMYGWVDGWMVDSSSIFWRVTCNGIHNNHTSYSYIFTVLSCNI